MNGTSGREQDGVRSLVISHEKFNEIREEKEFIVLLNLGRMVNTLQFALTVLRETPGTQTPADVRQGVNAFLLCGSLLFEGIRHVNVVAKKYPGFDRLGKFKKPYREGDLAVFEETVLKCVRNKIVSHFDDDVFIDSLRHIPTGDVVFAQCHTVNLEDMVFTLSDELVLTYVTHTYTNSWNPSRKDFVGMVETLIDLSREFIQMVVELMTGMLEEKGWVESLEN
ncbi:hypothetical protein ACFL55_00655 [Candidatus Latescibacterota bacterium]